MTSSFIRLSLETPRSVDIMFEELRNLPALLVGDEVELRGERWRVASRLWTFEDREFVGFLATKLKVHLVPAHVSPCEHPPIFVHEGVCKACGTTVLGRANGQTIWLKCSPDCASHRGYPCDCGYERRKREEG